MTIEFVKVHKTQDGRTFTVGQVTEIDASVAQELIKQGIAKERTKKGAGEAPQSGESEPKA
jgi:hypothetical protein